MQKLYWYIRQLAIYEIVIAIVQANSQVTKHVMVVG